MPLWHLWILPLLMLIIVKRYELLWERVLYKRKLLLLLWSLLTTTQMIEGITTVVMTTLTFSINITINIICRYV